MALTKTPVAINFAQGLDTKTDPKQVQLGRFLALQNAIFDIGGLLTKRNGFGAKPSLSINDSTFLSKHNGDLVAIGTQLQALSEDTGTWVDQGRLKQVNLTATPLVRTAQGQTSVDTVVASNGLSCSVYVERTGTCYYQINDSTTGQIVVPPVALPATSIRPRVFYVKKRFIITYLRTASAQTNLKFVAVPEVAPSNPGAETTIATDVKSLTTGYDCISLNSNLYVAYNANDGGGAIRMTYLDQTLVVHSTIAIAGHDGPLISLTADYGQGLVYIAWANDTSNNAYLTVRDQMLNSVLAPTLLFTRAVELITIVAQSDVMTIYYQVPQTYSYNSVQTKYIGYLTCNVNGSVSVENTFQTGMGLASKSFIVDGTIYVMGVYGGAQQPTYFLLDHNAEICAKLAYSNGYGFASTYVLPQGNVSGSTVSVGYLIKDLAVSVSKDQGAANSSNIYTQTGINLVNFRLNLDRQKTTEIAQSLHLTGGFMWQYDGKKPVEHGFFLWPEDLGYTNATTGGLQIKQIYYYVAVYAWTDAQGLVHRSAPSIPLKADISGSGTDTNVVSINYPMLRATYKAAPNPAIVEIYRWSTAQPVYYLVTSITGPQINNPAQNQGSFDDGKSDAQILGNPILYTTGGVLENIAAPAFKSISLFQSRLVGIDAENPNTLWYSKQVIPGVPVEMSDVLTVYVPPSVSTQDPSGPLECLAPLDDKEILFKKDAIVYINGVGPDNTGANDQFSEPTFITSTVGCDNQESIVLIPTGLMFQSDKGIWLLDRSLQTSFLGAPVEQYTQGARVLNALTIPGTNQVRFTLDSGITLMYDYYYGQWGTFNNIPAISSTLYQSLHTYLNQFGQVYQETPGSYLDGSNPVLLSFTTSWVNLAGVQGYERAYHFFLIGNYLSPHKLVAEIAYDYAPNASQVTTITPDNYTPAWGGDALWGGGGIWGGQSQLEQWRVFFKQQKCQAFQITLKEIYDPSKGLPAGAGVSLSGLDMIVGVKSGYPRLKAARSVG